MANDAIVMLDFDAADPFLAQVPGDMSLTTNYDMLRNFHIVFHAMFSMAIWRAFVERIDIRLHD